jgi:unsaturated rhamnogalacturonyl hydrolase
LWYQVLNKSGEKGNYTEATASSMFVYTIIKSVNNGYLPKSYKTYAKKGYDGIIKNLITVDENGVVNLNKCCAVAGLGGKPYRDGSYEYYINEEIRSNDAKGTGPFILASLEFEK